MAHSYPLMLDVTARLIVIIGGGKVAARKCEGLLASGATKIRVVSPAFCDSLPAGVERVTATYEPSKLKGAGLVFAATNVPAVNDAVVRDAQSIGVLVNRADGSDELPGDFSTPAMHRQEAVTFTVSAGGSPVLAARIRDQIAPLLDRDLVMMADAMREIRPVVLADQSLTEPQRREIFRSLASDEAIDILKRGGLNSLLEWIALQSQIKNRK
ncbi:hypothetical protein BH10PLA1_BH10PLA1_17020 [soil metagenome]